MPLRKYIKYCNACHNVYINWLYTDDKVPSGLEVLKDSDQFLQTHVGNYKTMGTGGIVLPSADDAADKVAMIEAYLRNTERGGRAGMRRERARVTR